MTVQQTNIDIVQGESLRYPVLVYQTADVNVTSPPGPAPTLMDLTGCTAHMQIRGTVGATILLDLTSGAGIDIDVPSSTVTIDFTGAMTVQLVAPTAQYDLWLLKPDGEEIPLLKGTINVDLAITNPVNY